MIGVPDLAFYLFAGGVIAGGLFTVIARNPVHSVLWLILSFISSAGLFVLLGAEFVAMLLVIVYVGAVAGAVPLRRHDARRGLRRAARGATQYLPIGLLIGVAILMQLGLAFGAWEYSPEAALARRAPIDEAAELHNTAALGLLLYEEYILLFQLAGLILLVAMIGAIVLTLRKRVDVKRQDVLAQMYRDPAKAMELKDVKPGQGLG